MMLAQVTNAVQTIPMPDPHSPSSVGWVCIVGLTIIMGYRQVRGLIRDEKQGDGPAKRDVTISTGAPTKAEFEKHTGQNHEDHVRFDARIGGVDRALKSQMDAKVEQLRLERKEDMGKLHTDVNNIAVKVGAIEATNLLQNQRLAGIDSKVDRVIERLGKKQGSQSED